MAVVGYGVVGEDMTSLWHMHVEVSVCARGHQQEKRQGMSDTKIRIDVGRALTLLREVVDEFGEDHVYTHPDGRPAMPDGEICRYEVNGKPGCIVGHALFRAGVKVEDLREMDEDEDGSSISTVDQVGFELDAAALRVFAEAQNGQDRGESWGAALRLALDRVADEQAAAEVAS